MNIQKLSNNSSLILSEKEMIHVLGGENDGPGTTDPITPEKHEKCEKCDKCDKCDKCTICF